MIQFHALEIPQLERFLERQKAGLSLKSDIDLDLILRQILQKANEFVPSESGSILLDDPFRKVAIRRENELVFIGSPETVTRKLRKAAEIGFFNTFMGEFNFADLPEADLMRSIRLFGEKVMPALRDYEPF